MNFLGDGTRNNLAFDVSVRGIHSRRRDRGRTIVAWSLLAAAVGIDAAGQGTNQAPLLEDGGTNCWHNWHTVRHGDVEKMFRDLDEKEPNEWDRDGLLRIAISDGRFRIIHPDMDAEKDGQGVALPNNQ